MKLDKALRREAKQKKATARRTLRVNSRVIAPLQSEKMANAARAFAKEVAHG